MTTMNRLAHALMFVFVLLLPAVLSARADAADVAIDNFTFSPQVQEITAGTTVTWTNRDDIPHAIAAVGREFRSKALDTDDSYSFTFTTPGTYTYFCSLHPHMKGTIVVK
jgi:plastocyanin